MMGKERELEVQTRRSQLMPLIWESTAKRARMSSKTFMRRSQTCSLHPGPTPRKHFILLVVEGYYQSHATRHTELEDAELNTYMRSLLSLRKSEIILCLKFYNFSKVHLSNSVPAIGTQICMSSITCSISIFIKT